MLQNQSPWVELSSLFLTQPVFSNIKIVFGVKNVPLYTNEEQLYKMSLAHLKLISKS